MMHLYNLLMKLRLTTIVLILVVMDDALVLVGENGKFKRMAA